MPNINIYVPEEMKVRMDAVEDRANWSAIAQRAFGFELARLEAVKEIKTMYDVIDRLRASKASLAEDQLRDGRAAGANWAKNEAEYNELRNIANFDDVGLDMLSGFEAAEHCYDLVFHPGDEDSPALMTVTLFISKAVFVF